MPVCVACGQWGLRPLCLDCRRRMRPGGAALLGDVPARFALHHSATGRLLVHRLKYHGLAAAADVLAGLMAPLLPPAPAVLVPIPRAPARRILYGVDPAWELAQRLGKLAHVPVVKALAAPLWWPRHAGRPDPERLAPRFRLRQPLAAPVVLVDDVITSGATVGGAVAAIPGHIASVLAATSPV